MKQDRYQSIFETTIDGIIVINSKGIVEDINASALELFGYEKSEIVNNNVSMLMGKPHNTNHDRYLHNYQSTRKAKIIGIGREVEGKRKDGSFFPFRLAVSEYNVSDSTFYTGIIHDLTVQKQHDELIRKQSESLELQVDERTQLLKQEIKLKETAQQALIESQKLYEAIAVNFPKGTISVLNKDFSIAFIEGSALNELGFGTSKLTGKNLLELLPEELKDLFNEKISSVFEDEDLSFEFDMNEHTFKARAVPLKDINGKVEQALLVETNISQEKLAEQEIYNALQKEKQLNELKTKFVSMASHEFRTPLSSILSSASLIEKYPENEQQDRRIKHINKIKNNVQNLNLILNDFLSLERIDDGLIKYNPIETDIPEFLNGVAEDAQPLLKPLQEIKISCTPKAISFPVDSYLLTNIMANLISNAVKYSSQNVEINCSKLGKSLKIEIADSGIGISEEDQKHLFNRFYRASNAGTIQGTGLGLHIVRRYISIMNAELAFESNLGQGSTFTIKLKDSRNEEDSSN